MTDGWYDVDRWGVPTNMFGPVGEDFYGLTGRIVLVSALLEQRLQDLYVAVARVPQGQMAGESGSSLIKALRRHLDGLPANRQEHASAVLSAAGAALARRHEVVHSLWPHTDAAPVRGWRGVRHRGGQDQPWVWTATHADQLPDVLTDLIQAVRQCTELRASL